MKGRGSGMKGTSLKNTTTINLDYMNWIDSWKAVENWQKPENWTVPSDWPTVEEMVQANDNKASDFYVAQFRIRFCNDDL